MHRAIAALVRPGWVLSALASAWLLAGCATHYDITLQNGDLIRAQNKPKKVDGNYVFKDVAGRDRQINALRIRQIEPVRAGSTPKPQFLPQ